MSPPAGDVFGNVPGIDWKEAKMRTKNIFSGIKARASREIFQKILRSKHVKIEKIFSRGQKSPEGFWCDQKDNEWVLLLMGAARLKFEGRRNLVRLEAGDYVNIPKHCRHRVEWTDPKQTTVWLAVFY